MDPKTIKHIASLARIELSEKEESKIAGQLSSILDYVEQLGKVNTEHIESFYQITGLVNSTRVDESQKGNKPNEVLGLRLINQAPDQENMLVKVKSILHK